MSACPECQEGTVSCLSCGLEPLGFTVEECRVLRSVLDAAINPYDWEGRSSPIEHTRSRAKQLMKRLNEHIDGLEGT